MHLYSFENEKLNKIKYDGVKQYLYEETLYHDIGKSKIPETILYKNGRLSSEEWELMKLHANYSQALYLSMVNNNDVSKEKAKVIRHHHENWDGSGYPEKTTIYLMRCWLNKSSLYNSLGRKLKGIFHGR